MASSPWSRVRSRKFFALGVLLVGCAEPPESESQEALSAADARPNVVIVLLDDLGYSDFGFMGSEIATPHVDRLAAHGVTLTQFYVEPRCSPTRASLLTGLSPHEAGLAFLATPEGLDFEAGPYQGYLPSDVPTLAEVLHESGYATYMSGKWHLGEAPDHWPRQRGFDRYFGLISGASSYYELIEDQPMVRKMALDNAAFVPGAEGFYMTDAITDHALDFARDHFATARSKPFLLYLAYTAPHWPLHASSNDIAGYADTYDDGPRAIMAARRAELVQRGLIEAHALQDEALPVANGAPAEWMATYAAMVTAADRGIGQLVELLDDAGALDNTLLLVFSDNGASAEDVSVRGLHNADKLVGERGSYLSYGEAWASVSNAPLRGHKGTTYEGGVRSPLVMHWPAGLQGRVGVDDQTVTGVADVYPTVLSAVGARHACTGVTCGENVLPWLLAGSTRADKTLYWEHLGWRAIRRADWKAVFDPAQGRWQLFDLANDPLERRDLAVIQPDVLGDLSASWDCWAVRVGVDDAALAGLVERYRAHLVR